MRSTLFFSLLGVLFSFHSMAQSLESDPKLQTVNQFISAFNSADAKGMAALVTDDVKWLTIKGDEISVEVEGRSALTAAMTDYFSSCPTCRSAIISFNISNERVSVLEEASWKRADVSYAQRSMAVYEFTDGLIRSVYYFPEETNRNH